MSGIVSDIQKGNQDWRDQLRNSIVRPGQIPGRFSVDRQAMEKVLARYPMRIPPYYLALIQKEKDPLWRQCVADPEELKDLSNAPDPLSEEDQSPVSAIIHRYPDRVIFLVSNQCAMYCRYCMRKRKVGDLNRHFGGRWPEIEQGMEYIRQTPEIDDVILSGGDPLLLETPMLGLILDRLKAISHVGMVRIHTRVPCTLPMRITENLVSVLKTFRPLYINTHFNHPDEVTPEAEKACGMLADAGIPLGCQTVLLKGVNDDPRTMATLMKRLVHMRVKPYYLHHPDPVAGTAHFRPSPDTGLAIMKQLRGNLSGLCVPQYMIDLPGGNGKIPLVPDYVKSLSRDSALVENFQGRLCTYPF
ncbi:MAG: KamA family radical SAM protein [Pseudomonadota bacterium]